MNGLRTAHICIHGDSSVSVLGYGLIASYRLLLIGGRSFAHMIPCRRKTASSGSLSLSPATDSFQLWGLSIAKTLSLFTCNKSVCYSIFETGCSHLLLTGAYAVYAYVPLSIPPTVVLNVMLSVNELSLL